MIQRCYTIPNLESRSLQETLFGLCNVTAMQHDISYNIKTIEASCVSPFQYLPVSVSWKEREVSYGIYFISS